MNLFKEISPNKTNSVLKECLIYKYTNIFLITEFKDVSNIFSSNFYYYFYEKYIYIFIRYKNKKIIFLVIFKKSHGFHVLRDFSLVNTS